MWWVSIGMEEQGEVGGLQGHTGLVGQLENKTF